MARDPYTLFPHDYILRATVLRFIPDFVKPNHLTVARLLLTPVVVYLLVTGNFIFGVPLFLVAGFTDVLDGSIARTRKSITPWGILFDPIADKLLIGLVALTVALRYYHPGLVIMAIAFDLLPMIIWAWRAKQNRALMMANLWGKTKMLLQGISMTLLLFGVMLQIGGLIDAGEIVLVVATVIAGIAAVTYSL